MGLVMTVVVAVSVVVPQLKGHKNCINQTLYYSWVLQRSLLAFHYNIVEYMTEPATGSCCNLAWSNQGCTGEVHIWFVSLGQAHSAEQT